MEIKACLRCKKSYSLEDFCYRDKNRNTRQSRCRSCTREIIREHYRNNTAYYLAKTKKRNSSIREEALCFLAQYLKSHPCVDCGESDIVVLEFDHLLNKTSDIASMVKDRISLKKIKDEILKCEVRCANYHRRITAKRGNWYKYSLKLLHNSKI